MQTIQMRTKILNQWNAEKAEKADQIGFKISAVWVEGLSAFIGFFRLFCVQKLFLFSCLVPDWPG